MSELGRGWTGGNLFRPARDVDVRYGHGLVSKESGEWPRYVVVSTRTAWKTVQPYLSSQPAGAAVVKMLDWDHLEEASDSLPDDVDLVVGIGGGTALDASKYVALRKELPVRLVPTAVSTGAIIHGVFAKWDGHSTIGGGAEWPYCDFEHVLVDYDLVLEAPWYLNTAGIGDILCMYSGIAEWRWSADQGKVPAVDESLTQPVVEYYRQIATEFPKTLGTDGALTADSVGFIMKSVHERDDRQIASPHASGAGHSLTQVLETVLQTGLIHGEVAALGAVAVCWATGDYEELIQQLDSCRVRFRPADMGLTKDQLRDVLEYAPIFYSERDMETVLASEPVVGERFEQFWKFIENC
ncbi:MAG: iron-containing alcohol dehydrogenase [Chloroflexi bacterium]|jgi:glycerol-1-phosphate dehydrogenase [NAD(P)+]|nr:iron-containing alcohol dehydrogenase [Chloroflexota bacterium]